MQRTRTTAQRTRTAPALPGLAALVVLGLAAPAVRAQDVIPPANADTYGSDQTVFPLYPSDVTFQVDYDAAQLGGIAPGSTITSLGFRLEAGQKANIQEFFSSYDLTLSQSNNGIDSLSSTFADNIGADATTVYDASLTMPAGALTPGIGGTPGPFFYIPFTAPYTYTGGDLLLTIRSTGDADYNHIIRLDANAIAPYNGPYVGDGKANTVNNPTSAQASSGTVGSYSYPVISLGVQPAPEPSSVATLGLGALAATGLILRAKKRCVTA